MPPAPSTIPAATNNALFNMGFPPSMRPRGTGAGAARSKPQPLIVERFRYAAPPTESEFDARADPLGVTYVTGHADRSTGFPVVKVGFALQRCPAVALNNSGSEL